MTGAATAAGGSVAGVVVLPAEPHAQALLSRHTGSTGASRAADRAAQLGAPPGVVRASPRRMGHLLQAIDELRDAWRSHGSALFVVRGDPWECVSALAARLGVRQVHTAPCLAFDERRENEMTERALAAAGVKLLVHDETTMIAEDDLPFAIDQLPEVFSNFRRMVEKSCRVRAPLAVPSLASLSDSLRADAEASSNATMAAADLLEAREAAVTTDPRAAFTVHGGRSHGLARMQRWFWETDCIARYKQTRDGLVGADFSSRLSSWLALGTLSPREVAAEIRRYEAERVANDSTYWMFFELLWRDYFHFWVRRWQGRAFKASGVLGRTPCGAQDREAFLRWCEGSTGEPFIDASMRELAATGQLSNRARQNVASWLARSEGIDWRWGAAWFESQLIDFDVGPNWGNWQYVAG
ncbi:MAG: DASH family cryptochrome, partial [Phycisphaerales bacterium]